MSSRRRGKPVARSAGGDGRRYEQGAGAFTPKSSAAANRIAFCDAVTFLSFAS